MKTQPKKSSIVKLLYNADYIMGIYQYCTYQELIETIQYLHKKTYDRFVPRLLSTVFLLPFHCVPKLAPKHLFINLGRTTNLMTHQCKTIYFTFADIQGKLTGEFLVNTDIPDGRCRFIDFNEEVFVLGYFVNGQLQKGPLLWCDKSRRRLVVKSKS